MPRVARGAQKIGELRSRIRNNSAAPSSSDAVITGVSTEKNPFRGRLRILREPSSAFIAPALHEGGRRNHRDLLERIEREEISVARDGQIARPWTLVLRPQIDAPLATSSAQVASIGCF
jgi:hypothetical protein